MNANKNTLGALLNIPNVVEILKIRCNAIIDDLTQPSWETVPLGARRGPQQYVVIITSQPFLR